MRIFFSNRLEQLVEQLEDNLFPQGSSPFASRLLVVPSRAIEKGVRIELAKREVVGGMRSMFLDHAVTYLSTKEPPSHPLHLTLLIEKAVSDILQADNLSELWQPLRTYLQGHENRKMPLCRKLATLFNRYALYGERVIPQWEKGWQMALWTKLFGQGDFFPLPRKDLPEQLSVHLFGFSHLPQVYFRFFEQLQKKAPVHIYHLSACQEFWSDMLSERGQKVLMQEQENMESYFSDHHPLLANFGRVGREFAKQIEESEEPTEECYVFPEAKSALNQLQQELLLAMQEGSLPEDNSLQIHISTTAHREIENLFHTLFYHLAEEKIEPKDVVVMAPDITPYVPFIRAHFGELLDYQISDIPLDSTYSPLLMLLELEQKRWSAPALLELFYHPLFRQKQRWKEKEIGQIRSWIEKASIRWGFDENHRQHILTSFGQERATWMAGFDYLLEQLATASSIALTQAELLGQLITVVRGLFQSLTPFHDGTQKSFSQWCEMLKMVAQNYLSPLPDQFYQNLLQLKRADVGKLYRFETLYPLIKELLQQEGGAEHQHHLQAVRFCSMLPMRAISAKVVVLLGMNHDSFPRKEHLQNLDLLAGEKLSDYYPTRGDFDRYLFLEAILSARDTLLISYQSNDGEKTPPSHLVSQLRSYCKKITTVVHPPYPFDERYFDPAFPALKNSSSTHFKAASALGREKEQTHSPVIITQPRHVKREAMEIDLSSLIRLVRYPLKSYLKEKLDLRFVRKESLKAEEEFHLSALQMVKLKQQALQKPLNEVMQRARKGGDFPLGSFAAVATARLTKEVTKQERLLSQLSIKKEQILTVDLPPLKLFGGEVTVVGAVENVSPQGLLVEGDFTLRSAIKYWPQFLALNAQQKTPLIFAKKGIVKEPFFEDPLPLLENLIDYYFLAQHNPSPLFPEWLDKILQNDQVGLEKKIAQSLSDLHGRSYDESMHWAFPSPPSAEAILQHWGEIAAKLYGGILDGWF